jgi:signal transduction histidine kinase
VDVGSWGVAFMGDAAPRADVSLDVAAARLVARLRLVVLTVLAIAVPLTAGEDAHAGFQFLVALGAVPVAGVLAGGVERLRAPAASAIGVAIDLTVLLAAQRTFTSSATAVLAVILSVVLIAAYTGGPVVGLLAALVGVAVALAGPGVDAHDVDGNVLVLFVAAMAVALVVVERSVSERSRADVRSSHFEGRAEAVLERVAEAVVVTDEHGVVVTQNPAADRFVVPEPGTPPRCGAGLRLHAAGRVLSCETGCALALVAAPEGGPVDLEVTCETASGERVPVLASVAPVVDAAGVVREYVHSLRDITRLKQADEAKSIFLATATHELKTPLTVISGFLETIDRPEMDAAARSDAVAIMRRRARELAQIIERMLLASRIESGRVNVSIEPTDLPTVVAERVGALRASTGRVIALEVPHGLPAALADGGAVAIVLDHLLDNALKYSAGSIAVRVHADVDDVVVEVADEGMGMDEQQVAHCFEKFWQADSGDTRRTSGTGIGLYIVASLVEAMGGRVDVRSVPDVGTTFAVRLQRADRSRHGDDADGAPGPPAVASPDAVTEPSIVREFMRQIGIPSPRPQL